VRQCKLGENMHGQDTHLQGLKPGEQVITHGSFIAKSQLLILDRRLDSVEIASSTFAPSARWIVLMLVIALARRYQRDGVSTRIGSSCHHVTVTEGRKANSSAIPPVEQAMTKHQPRSSERRGRVR